MLIEMGRSAREASRQMACAATATKNRALVELATRIDQSQNAILRANQLDIQAARVAGMNESLIDRLTLTGKRLGGLASDLHRVAGLPDPVGERFDERVLPNSLKLWKQRVPLGVLGVVYESRPNVTVDVAGLSIKTGNAAILRGGKETTQTNGILVEMTRDALIGCGLPANALQFISNPDRGLVLELLQLHEYLDIIIPRGGESLHRFCRENSQIPVITGGIGICHIFVDDSADLDRALPVIHNAKTQRPSVCNALDTLLVHQGIAERFLPRVVEYLAPAGVTFRADDAAARYLNISGSADNPSLPASVLHAEPKDFDTEWMSLVLGLKVVNGIDEAIAHTNAHSMGHSDSILTEDDAHAARWINEVDSAAVYVNASTRFTDGGQFGLGAEVAISTQRLHARGPMGLRELTTYKWVAKGTYQVRE
jgi:glutamate-5-semialdehyde dehydrogenase